MYERHRERLLPRGPFLWRLAKHVTVAVLVIAGSLVMHRFHLRDEP